MGTTVPAVTPSAQPPAPLGAATLDELTQRLRALRVWAGQPSFAEIVDRLRHHRALRGASHAVQRVSRTTVYDCFRSGRSRLDVDLLVDVVEALGVSADEASAWRLAYGSVTSRHEQVRLVEVRAEMASPETYFTGRTEALARLAEAPRGTTSVLVGMAGVGKTQLALCVASRLTQEPDSMPVFVALRGGDQRHAPASPDSVLRAVLHFAGATDQTVRNLSVDERAQFWAAWIRERRAVVVFDDAFDSAQLQHVVPPDHGGRILVTSRRRIDGLENSTAITVEPLTVDESVALLRRIIGTGSESDDAAAARIARICGHLPLELALTGAVIAERDDWSLDDHARRLEQRPRGTNVGRALAAMTGDLDPAANVLFRRLAIHPGSRIAPWAAAALADLSDATTSELLESLTADHLVRRVIGLGDDASVELHDLVREHATDLLRDADSHRVQRDAVRRLAGRALPIARRAVTLAVPNATFPTPEPAGHDGAGLLEPSITDDALAWLAAERANLVDLIGSTLAFDLPDETAALATTLAPYLRLMGDIRLVQQALEQGLVTRDPVVRAAIHRDLALTNCNHGHFAGAVEHLRLADDLAPDPTPGRVHGLLAGVYSGRGQSAEALEHYRIARDEAERAGNPARRARMDGNIGNVLRLLGDFAEAETVLRDAIAASEEADDIVAVIHEHSTLGLLFEDSGRFDDALEHLAYANDLAASVGSEYLLDQNTTRMAAIHHHLGNVTTAFDLAQRSITLARDSDNANGEAEARVVLGEIMLTDARAKEASREFQYALESARVLGAMVAETSARHGLGAAALALDDPTGATAHYRAALDLSTGSNDRLEAARSHRGLGEAADRLGDPVAAASHFETALGLLDELNPREAAELRQHLSDRGR